LSRESVDAEFTAKEYLFVLDGYRARRLHPIRGWGSTRQQS